MHLNGEITVEVLDAQSTALPEWSGTNRATFRGNTHSRSRIFEGRVPWPGERSLSDLRGRTIRLQFHLVHARLFTIEARHSLTQVATQGDSREKTQKAQE